MSLDVIRGWIRQIGEAITFVAPIAGKDTSTRAEAVRSDESRLGVHGAYILGGESKKITLSGTSASTQFTAGARILRVSSDADCFFRVDTSASPAADATLADGVTIWMPLGSPLFVLLPDPSASYYLKAIEDSGGGGILYAHVVQ